LLQFTQLFYIYIVLSINSYLSGDLMTSTGFVIYSVYQHTTKAFQSTSAAKTKYAFLLVIVPVYILHILM